MGKNLILRPYIIEKESSFGIYRYTINDIYTGNTLLVVNRDYTNVDTNSILSIEPSRLQRLKTTSSALLSLSKTSCLIF